MRETLQRDRVIEKQDLAAEFVFGLMQLDERQPQLELFETEDTYDYKESMVARLNEENPGKIIISHREVDRYRYIAAFLGAGFHMSQFEEVAYEKNEDAGKFVIGYWFQRTGHVPERSTRANRMRDEVSEELFTQHVPTTKLHLSSGMLITSEEDLKEIFRFDYLNLQACRDLGMDLLYEKENI